MKVNPIKKKIYKVIFTYYLIKKEQTLWGTYGKDFKTYPNIKHVPIGLCSSNHLNAILETQHQIDDSLRKEIRSVLKDRESHKVAERFLVWYRRIIREGIPLEMGRFLYFELFEGAV